MPTSPFFRFPLAFVGQLLGYALEIIVLCALGWLLIKKLGPARTIYKVKLGAGQIRREILWSARIALFDSAIAFALLEAGVVRLSATAVPTAILVFAAHFLFFEVWFYATHVLRHQKWLWRYHAIHHQSRVCTPLTNFTASIVDRAISSIGFWIPLVLFARMDMLSPVAVALILIVSNVGGVLLHANVETFLPLDRNAVVQTVAHSVSSHALHHARVRGNYGQFTSFLDKLFGTYIADTPEVTARALRGEPLTALQERAGAGLDGAPGAARYSVRRPPVTAVAPDGAAAS